MTAISISEIAVADRYRRDFGDIAALARSIDDVGLLQPVVLAPDYTLIAGQRRLKAMQSLGYDVIEAHIVHGLDDAVSALRAERDENTCRKDFTPTEEHALYEALLELERPKARDRQAHGQTAPGKNASGNFPEASTARSREAASEAATGSAGRYKSLDKVGEVKAAAADEAAPEPVRETARQALSEMDSTGRVDGSYRTFKDAEGTVAEAKPNQPNRGRRACRRPLPDFAKDTGWSLRRDVERVERIVSDDRITANKKQVAAHLRDHLTYTVETCQGLLDRLNEMTGE